MHELPYFNLSIPSKVPGVDGGILDPRKTYTDPTGWDEKARHLAALFIKNFEKFTDDPRAAVLVAAGPQL